MRYVNFKKTIILMEFVVCYASTEYMIMYDEHRAMSLNQTLTYFLYVV